MIKRIISYFTRYKSASGFTKYNAVPGLIIVFAVLLSTYILWLPFILRVSSWFGLNIENSNFLYIYKHFDGPLYIVPAKTWYLPNLIDAMHIDIKFPAKYFAAHLPLYPALIALFAVVFGYLKSMIFVNIVATTGLALFFYWLVKKFNFSKHPLLLTMVFIMLPRFLIVRSVGAPESLFLFLVLGSLFFFEKQKFLLAGLLGGLATMTKTPGILLFVGYGLTILEQIITKSHPEFISESESKQIPKQPMKQVQGDIVRNDKWFNWQWLFLGLIPLGLLVVFGIYAVQYKDFFAYFNSGDNIHLVFPFSVYNFQKNWVGTAWLEDTLFYFVMYLIALFNLKDIKYRSFFYFGMIFFIASTFVQHRDIGRYTLPLWPLACIAFEKFFTSKKFLIVLAILLPAIFLYGWNFLLYNVMPIGEWQPFL